MYAHINIQTPTPEVRLIRAGFTDQISALDSLPFKAPIEI